MGLSATHLIVVALVVLVLFGRGKVSELMGDFGKGIRGFRLGLTEDTEDARLDVRALSAPSAKETLAEGNHSSMAGIDGGNHSPNTLRGEV